MSEKERWEAQIETTKALMDSLRRIHDEIAALQLGVIALIDCHPEPEKARESFRKVIAQVQSRPGMKGSERVIASMKGLIGESQE